MSAEQETGYALEGTEEVSRKTDKNLIRDIIGIITDPSKTFGNVLQIGYWLGILIVIVLVAGGLEQIYHSQVIDLTIQKMEQQAGENAAQIQGAVEFYQNPVFTRPLYFLFTTIGQVVFILIWTVLAFFISSILAGGTAKFKQVWIVSCWSYVIVLLSQIIKTPLILAKNNVEAGLNFGLLFTEDMVGTGLHKFFSVIDLFGIWHFIVFGIGLVVLYRFTTKKGIGIAFVIWLLLTAASGLGAYFS